MKSKEELLKILFVTLAELQSGTADEDLEIYLQHKLETLYNILGEDVPEAYWIQVEKEINKVSKKDIKTCPVCGETYKGAPALSRKDSKTEICSDCGMLEALEAMQNSL